MRSRRVKPVFGDPRYHERYFSYGIPSDQLSDAPLEEFLRLAEADDQGKIDKAAENLIQIMPGIFFNRLKNGRMTSQQIEHIISALLATELALRRGQTYEETELTRNIVYAVRDLLKKLLELEASDDVRRLGRTVVEKAKPEQFADLLKLSVVDALSPYLPQ